MLRVGIDIGGTFTDFVLWDEETGALRRFKGLSTPSDPAQAVLRGLEQLAKPDEIVHGSTVATNALLERRGARTALIATRGFADLLHIARQNRQELYDFAARRPDPVVKREHCWEVEERISSQGEVLRALDPQSLAQLGDQLREQGIQSVAVCLLFSFLHPEHESAVGDHLRREGFAVSLSSEILPEFREYERASTTAVNAYVTPLLRGYLNHLEHGLSGTRLRIMQSNGGSLQAREAASQGVRSLLSGPAGGVLGAVQVARQSGFERIITLDMGGTSTDVSLAMGEPQVSAELTVAGFPVRVPMIDIHSVGSGGGSIARADPGGALRVGPQSAGADPGPACYGLGGVHPTVTDANLVLGRISAGHFLGGDLALSAESAEAALGRLAIDLGMEDPRAVAMGVIQVVNAQMARAMRVISVERGHDPGEFTLVCFGGAGGLHAMDLARLLGMHRVLIPRLASTLSAFGMLTSDHIRDYVQTVMLPGTTQAGELNQRYEPLRRRAREQITSDGFEAQQVSLAPELDLRYRGQSYELTLPYREGFAEHFHQAHQRRFGASAPEAEIEIVSLRLRARVALEEPKPRPWRERPESERYGRLEVVFQGGSERVPHYTEENLHAGMHVLGPALFSLSDTTVLLRHGDECAIDRMGNFAIGVGD